MSEPWRPPVLPDVILLPDGSGTMLPGALNVGALSGMLSILHQTRSDPDALPATEVRNHDVSFVVVSRASLSEILPYKKRMGWHFSWVTTAGNDFNYDFQVSFTPEQIATGCSRPSGTRRVVTLSLRAVVARVAP